MDSTEITPRTRLQAKEHLTVEELDGEILVYDPENDKTFNFNGTGAFVWSLANGNHSVDAIIQAIHEAAPETERNAIRDDVEQFIRELLEDGLITLQHEQG